MTRFDEPQLDPELTMIVTVLFVTFIGMFVWFIVDEAWAAAVPSAFLLGVATVLIALRLFIHFSDRVEWRVRRELERKRQ